MKNYLDLLLYRPTKKDICERCEEFELNKTKKTEIQKKNHAAHLRQGEYMQNRMCNHQVTCSSRTLGPKKPKIKKKGVKKTQLGDNGANDSENAPEKSQQNKAKDSNESNAPPTTQQCTFKDSNEKNASETSQQDNAKDSNGSNAPLTTQQSKSKDSNENKETPKKCDDLIAHIATDMQQIQNVPKLQVGMAYYKSKVNN